MKKSKTATRRDFLKGCAAAGLVVASSSPLRVFASSEFDLVLKGGTIADGTGAPLWTGDIGITGDTIKAVGNIAAERGKRVIDIAGKHVCPGFIDIHSHSDGGILAYPSAESRVRQGITTELTGNCGFSASPMEGAGVEKRRKAWMTEEGIDAGWSDIASYFATVEQKKIAINHALLVGQGTIRESVAGLADRPLAQEEMNRVLAMVSLAMDHGAYGVSTGLEYVPGRYTPTEEIVAMARIVASRGGLYASHIRNEVATVLEAVSEAIEIGRRAGVRVEISHLKACGSRHWAKQRAALDLIESARSEGVEVLADAYPYTAYSTGLTVVFANWALEGGSVEMMKRLRNTGDRARIRKEVVDYIANEPGEYRLIVISSIGSERNRSLVGKNMRQIADIWKMEPVDALLRLIEEEEGNVGYIGHAMSPENVEMVLSHPLVMIGSDGYTMAPEGKALERQPHPRSYGTYPRVLGHYVREREAIDLAVAIKKMTSMPADQIGIYDRGRIASGKKADIVVFDAGGVKDQNSFENPHLYPVGIDHVLVNGVVVVENGTQTDQRPGRVLRKS